MWSDSSSVVRPRRLPPERAQFRLTRFAIPLLLILAPASCSTQRRELPVIRSVPPFDLTAQDGRPFSSTGLAGKIWAANFIFTNCAGPCPRMTSLMSRVQTATANLPGVSIVSFTVDPERDTPPVLAAYAARFQADPQRWHFLTGPRDTLHLLKRDGFLLGSVDGSLEHSTRFVLVDDQARIRGFYSSSESDAVRKLIDDIRYLVATRDRTS